MAAAICPARSPESTRSSGLGCKAGGSLGTAGSIGEVIGSARGVGVYTEIDRRRVAVPLTLLPAHGETLQILFRDDDSRPGTVLATANLTAP